jgi:hypothetical protein
MPIPVVTSLTTLSSNGLIITAQPGHVGTPSSGGLFGFVGLINSLKGLASSATSIANTLDQISEQGALWAAGSLSDSGFSTSVDGLLNTATSDLSNWVSTMNGVFEDFNNEVYEMTEDGLRRVFPARTGAVEEFDILKALRKLTTNLVNIRTDVIAKIKEYWIQGTTAAAVLAAAEEALRNFGDYPWDNEKPQPISSSSTTNSTDTNTSLISTTSSSSSSSTSVCHDTPESSFLQATRTICNANCFLGKSPGTAVPPFTTSDPNPNPDFKKRAIAGRITMNPLQKRANPSTITSFGGCSLNTPAASPVTLPGWPAVTADILQPDQANNMAARYSIISRYDRATREGCVFTTTRLNANDFANAPQWQDFTGTVRTNNNMASLDHACRSYCNLLAKDKTDFHFRRKVVAQGFFQSDHQRYQCCQCIFMCSS